MKRIFSPSVKVIALFGASGLAFMPVAAMAQDQEAAADEDNRIVVTGTLIRGEAPVGSNAITLGGDRIEETAATSGNEILASLPQVTNYFNNVPVADLAIAPNQIQIARPNIREITPSNASSSGTLILFDGHRIASAGVAQASIDPDVIPFAAIERVDVVTEGGSAIYGADAVAGVINFITRRRFDGIELDGSYGFADNYWQWDANAIAGTDWGTGSAYVAGSYSRSDALFGRERDFIRRLDYTSQPYTPQGRNCADPNLAINYVVGPFTAQSITAGAPAFVQGTFNACDTTDNSAIVPEVERYGGLLSLTQDLDDSASIDVRAFYSRRDSLATSDLGAQAPLPSTFQVPAGLPASVPFTIPGAGTFQARPVANGAFSFGPALGFDAGRSTTRIEEWGFNAELRKNVFADWEVRTLVNWSGSDSRFSINSPNLTRLNAASRSGALNPFNIAATDPSLLADILDNELAGQATDDLLDLRAIGEGSLFDLPGGEVRLAVGVEYMEDTLQLRQAPDLRIGTLSSRPYDEYNRNVWSAFGELLLPVTDFAEISLAGRYDDYSDFGSTFNPKIGASVRPIDWFTIRGNWGTSFTAPTPLDQLRSNANTITAFPFVAFTRPGDTPAAGSQTVALQGSVPNLQPQEADTWSIGFDASPPFIDGLNLNFSYYNVEFTNILSTPTPNVGIFTNFPNNIQTSVTGISPEDLRAFGAQQPGGTALVESLITQGVIVYELVDFRTGNFGIVRVEGLDFGVNYTADTDFGAIFASVNGNYQLTREQQVSPTSAVVDVLEFNTPDLRLRSTLGADIGGFRAQASWNHTAGYDIVPLNTVPVQSSVGAFNTVDLFFRYQFPAEEGILQDLQFTLNIDNLFDEDPPIFFGNGPRDNGYANGFTLGRMVVLGVRKRF